MSVLARPGTRPYGRRTGAAVRHASWPWYRSGRSVGQGPEEDRREEIAKAGTARRRTVGRIILGREAPGLEKLPQEKGVGIGKNVVAQKMDPPSDASDAAESVEKGSTPGRDGGMS